MKQTILLVLFLAVFGFKSFADEQKTVKAKLDNATVFFKGAELTHSASSALLKGDNEIWIEGLSPNIDRNSLKISATGGAVVTSYEFSVDFLDKKIVSTREKVLKDSIDACNKELRDLKVRLSTNEDLLGLLQANKSIGGSQNGLNVSELVKMMDYYQLKSNELQNEKSKLDEKIDKLDELVEKLEKQLSEVDLKNAKTSGVLKLKLTSPTGLTSGFTVSYYTSASGWVPYYDINVRGIDKPVQIASKAKVMQTTGLDWNKVKLTLSTSAPSSGKVAPLFSAWFLNFLQPKSMSSALAGMVPGLAFQNSYSYEEAPKVKIRGTAALAKSAQPIYIVDGLQMSAEDFGQIEPSMIQSIDVLKDASSTAIYGSRGANGVIVVSLKNSMSDFVTRGENQLNMTYNIDLPYTINGNGKMQSIDLQTVEVPAEFKYYSAPKLDTETFLLAEISDWTKLGLLSGKANITYDGTYVGETSIDISSISEKLSLTLGSDKRVVVKREKLQDFSSRKFLGNDIKQEFAFQITVKNNQSQTIKMVLKDQYPISSQKEIEVELLKDTSTPTHKNEEVGVLVWEFELKPGETRTFRNAYSVKYPKDRELNL